MDTRMKLETTGFVVLPSVFTNEEIETILSLIASVDTSRPMFRKTNDLFAIRQFFKEVPQVANLVFTSKIKKIISDFFGEDYFVVKSIYFDKPAASNWFVSYYQDLTISVDKKIETEGFGPWTVKQNQFSVQPPLSILQNNFTIRIHLDKTDENNGALKVIPRSHLQGIYRPEKVDWNKETETVCDVEKGGLMLMKPLLLHSSGRTINSNKRRVVHIEFSKSILPDSIRWSEQLNIFN